MIFRSSDVCARLGGDEYVVLLPEESSEYFKYMRSRIVSAFEEFNVHSGKPYTLSCSIGMVSYDPATPPDLNMLLRLADEEMYRCKHSL